MELVRRDFLALSGLSALSFAAAPQIAFANTPRNSDVMVVIFLRGAMDGLSAVVPFTESNYYAKRSAIAVPRPGETGGAIALTNQFALHPALAPLKRHWDNGSLAVAHATGLVTPSRSHFDAQDFMERAVMAQGGLGTGWFNRFLSQSARTGDPIFRAVAVGKAVPRSAGGPVPVVALSSAESFDVQSTSSQATALRGAVSQSFVGPSGLDSAGIKAFQAINDLATTPSVNSAPENGASYPTTAFGGYLRILAGLIKSPLGVEAATVDIGGWDTHRNQVADLATLFDELGKALDAFVTDLGSQMSRVSIVTMTEFGRRLTQNASGGTDHGRASAMFALGGGVVGKQVVADWPGLADSALDQGDLRVTLDYRRVLAEWLTKRGGVSDIASVFPAFSEAPTSSLFRAR